jgi:hypothetical protein
MKSTVIPSGKRVDYSILGKVESGRLFLFFVTRSEPVRAFSSPLEVIKLFMSLNLDISLPCLLQSGFDPSQDSQCGIGLWPSPCLSYCQRMVQLGCTVLSQGALSEMRPLSAHFNWGTFACTVQFTKQTAVLASHTGYVLRVPRRAEFPTPDCLCFQLDIGTLDADALQLLNTNLWLMSPACQPYTMLNPNAKGPRIPTHNPSCT